MIGPESWGTSAGRRRQFGEWTLAWPAGTRTEYHPLAAHWVIAELLETLSGRPYADVVNDRVAKPAGVDAVLGPAAIPAVSRRSRDDPHRRGGTERRAPARRVRPTGARARHDRVTGAAAEPEPSSGPRPRRYRAAAASPAQQTSPRSTSRSCTTPATRIPRLAGRRHGHHPQRQHQRQRRRACQSHGRRASSPAPTACTSTAGSPTRLVPSAITVPAGRSAGPIPTAVCRSASCTTPCNSIPVTTCAAAAS